MLRVGDELAAKTLLEGFIESVAQQHELGVGGVREVIEPASWNGSSADAGTNETIRGTRWAGVHGRHGISIHPGPVEQVDWQSRHRPNELPPPAVNLRSGAFDRGVRRRPPPTCTSQQELSAALVDKTPKRQLRPDHEDGRPNDMNCGTSGTYELIASPCNGRLGSRTVDFLNVRGRRGTSGELSFGWPSVGVSR